MGMSTDPHKDREEDKDGTIARTGPPHEDGEWNSARMDCSQDRDKTRMRSKTVRIGEVVRTQTDDNDNDSWSARTGTTTTTGPHRDSNNDNGTAQGWGQQ
jgi:hypothetical protein